MLRNVAYTGANLLVDCASLKQQAPTNTLYEYNNDAKLKSLSLRRTGQLLTSGPLTFYKRLK